MCGIFGFIGKKSFNLKDCTDIISYRGPDSEGFLGIDLLDDSISQNFDALELSKKERSKILFGFRRLAILDISEGSNQPMIAPNNDYAIIFNGEIYNYLELREELKTFGINFRTNSDTEVLLNSYIYWGQDCVSHFNGMWAFSILDLRKRILFCSRDRFGVKPFYYNFRDNQFIFGSEIKQLHKFGLKKELNNGVIKEFLDHGIINHNENTYFNGIFQLLPGHNLCVDFSNSEITIEKYRYYKLVKNKEYEKLEYNKAIDKFKELFKESLKYRFRSDVPVGTCLSGGLDSSTIVSCASAEFGSIFQTFSSIFLNNPNFDESEFINTVIEKFPLIEPKYTSVSPEDVLQNIDSILFHQDEPFSTFSLVSQWNVIKLAKENGVKVLLDGQGGDEILGGYRKYFGYYLLDLLKGGDIIRFIKEILNFLISRSIGLFSREGLNRYFVDRKMNDFYTPMVKDNFGSISIKFNYKSDYKSISLRDIEQLSFPPLLRYEDRNSMAFSIEARMPFMDYNLVEFLHSIPVKYLIKDGFTKAILRDSMIGILPDKVRLRKSKLGFDTPESDWLNGSLRSHFKEYFFKMKNPFLNNMKIYEDFLCYPNSKLFSKDFTRFYIFDRWYKLNFN